VEYSYTTEIPWQIEYLPILIFFLVMLLIILIQIFLSKMKNQWPGLILPILFFIFSTYNIIHSISGHPYFQAALDYLAFSLLCNIPTVIILVIYIICRTINDKKITTSG
jgi:hypothetical protein